MHERRASGQISGGNKKVVKFKLISLTLALAAAANTLAFAGTQSGKSPANASKTTTSKSVNPHMVKAKQFEDQLKYEDAANEYAAAVKDDPKNLSAFARRAYMYFLIGQYQKCIDIASESISTNGDAASYKMRADAKYAMHQFPSAVEDYNIVVKMAPDDGPSFRARGDAYYAMEKFAEAIKNYDKALALNPDSSTFAMRADAYFSSGNLKKAVPDYDAAIKLNPNEQSYYKNRANALYQLNDFSRAITDYSRIISMKPKDPSEFYFKRGDVYLAVREYDSAIADFTRAIDLKKEPRFFQRRSFAYTMKGQTDLAKNDKQTADSLRVR